MNITEKFEHWSDKKKMLRDKAAALRLVNQRGIILCYDSRELQLIKNAFLPILKTFPVEIYDVNLSLLYVYRQSEQTDKGKFDATCDFNTKFFLHTFYNSSIGISAEALNCGDPDYVTMLFIHELTHLIYGDTEERDFFRHMDGLLERYNAINKTSIQNDYVETTLENLKATRRENFKAALENFKRGIIYEKT